MAKQGALRALSHRNFRLFFVGQGISLTGTWMQQVAMSWVVYLLTRDQALEHQDASAYWLGLVGFAGQIPAFFLAPVAGVFADHVNRHRLIMLTQTLAMAQAFLLAGLMFAGVLNIAWILALAVFLGLINAFDMPARQAFLSEMIDDKEHLSNAIALNSSMFNAARLVGPALAATLLAAVGPALCFLLNALSYVAVLFALRAMRVAPRQKATSVTGVSRKLYEGFRYVAGFAPIRAILLLVALVSLAGTSFSVLLPIIADKTLGGEAGTFGMLTIASGLGALSGAVFLATRTTVVGLGRWIAVAPLLLAAGLAVLGVSASLWLSLAALVIVGFGMMTQMGASNILVQTLVDEDKRGRVMSFYTMAFVGLAPFGSLAAGMIAARYGLSTALFVAAAGCGTGGLLFGSQLPRLRRIVRPHYVKLGILPEIPSAVHPTVAPPSPNVDPLKDGPLDLKPLEAEPPKE